MTNTTKNMSELNETRLGAWMHHYERNLRDVITEKPEQYGYSQDEVNGVLNKMRPSFVDGTFNKDGEAIKRTCKAMAIPYTYAGIKGYLYGTDGQRTDAEVDAADLGRKEPDAAG